MKKGAAILFFFSIFMVSCEQEDSLPTGYCGNTGYYGPVRYYLTPYDKSLFNSYRSFHTLTFVDSVSSDTLAISYSSGSQLSDDTTGNSQVQGDTVDFGERAGISYNSGESGIQGIEYYFAAYPQGVDSIGIFVSDGIAFNQYASHVFYWTLNLVAPGTSGTTGYTPFVLLDSVTFLSHTFYDVYLLQNGNSLSPSDSSNNCYYTKANGIIAFTNKRYNKFWIRTNF